MRFNIIHTRTDTVIGGTDQIEGALAVLKGDENLEFTIVDRWSGVALDRPVRTVTSSLVTEDNPYGLPLHFIKHELMKPGQKIPMIKLVRELTTLGLGEAKAIIDRIETKENLRARQVDNGDQSW